MRQHLVWQLIDVDPSLAPGSQLPAACVALARLAPQFHPEVPRLEFLFEELCSEINAEGPGRGAALDGLTRLIMISLLRLCASSLEARPARHEDLRIFHRFNELIEVHYLQHWPLSCYADGIGVTEARLNDVCRRIADLPSKRLILERIMQEAKRPVAVHRQFGQRKSATSWVSRPGLFQSVFPALCTDDSRGISSATAGVERDGIVRRRKSSEDQRRVFVALTEQGQQCFVDISAGMEAIT